MYYGLESLKSEGMLPVEITENDRQQSLRLFWGDAVGEGAALARRVVGVLVPGTLGIKEPVELHLVEGGVLLGLSDPEQRDCSQAWNILE